jgi:hypothetical protein
MLGFSVSYLIHVARTAGTIAFSDPPFPSPDITLSDFEFACQN